MMKSNKSIKTILTLAGASLVCSASLQAANLIVNGDFASHGAGNNTPFVDPGGDWTTSGVIYHYNDNNFGTGNYVYVWGAGSVNQDVSDPWTTTSTIDISLTAAMTTWGSGSGSVLVELRKASDDTVLWDNTTAGLTPGTVSPLSWSIDASTLAATAGEDLNLNITANGLGTAFDDVFLEVNTAVAAVPEPSTTALLGLGGLALVFRRRK